MGGVARGVRGSSRPSRRRRIVTQGVGLSLALGLGLAGGSGEGWCQSAPAPFQARQGWLGVSLEYVTVGLSGQNRTVAAVSAVVRESPAERAGIQVGDTLTHVDGQAVSPRVVAAMSAGLMPGDLVRLALRRQGRQREVLVEAAPWPSFPGSSPVPMELPFSPGPWLLLRLDSVRGAILRNLDSLAMAIRPGPAPSTAPTVWTVPHSPAGATGLRPGDSSSLGLRSFPTTGSGSPSGDTGSAGGLPLRSRASGRGDLQLSPSGRFLGSQAGGRRTGGPPSQADSLQKALEQVNRALTELRRQELARLRELPTGQGGGMGGSRTTDPELRRLAEEEKSLLARRLELQARLEQLQVRAPSGSGSRPETEWPPDQGQFPPAGLVPRSPAEIERDRRRLEEEMSRMVREAESQIWTPLRILTVGHSFLAGAQLQELNPQLAQYFPVGRGVLVTQVLEGTPAAEAGVQGGDVIVRVGTQEVTGLEELRAALATARRPLRLEVVRRDGRKIVVLPR